MPRCPVKGQKWVSRLRDPHAGVRGVSQLGVRSASPFWGQCRHQGAHSGELGLTGPKSVPARRCQRVGAAPDRVTYVYYEQYLTVVAEGAGTLALCLVPTFVVSFLLLGMDPRSSAATIITITMILLGTGGAMALWDIPYNAVTLINLVAVRGTGGTRGIWGYTGTRGTRGGTGTSGTRGDTGTRGTQGGTGAWGT